MSSGVNFCYSFLFTLSLEKQTKMKKKIGIRAFFKRTWLAVKRANFSDNKVSPDPRSGPSGLEPMDPADPQPDPSSLEPTALQDPDPGPSSLNSELMPVPGPSSLRPTPDATHEPVSFASLYEMGQRLGIGGFGTVFKGTRASDGQQVEPLLQYSLNLLLW